MSFGFPVQMMVDAATEGLPLTGLLVWYDPSDLTTLFQDTAGTTPVTATGQSVARMNDKSGNGYNTLRVGAVSMPTYEVTSTFANLLGVDSGDICMSVTFPGFVGLTGATICIALRTENAVTPSDVFVMVIDAAGASTRAGLHRSNGGTWNCYLNGGNSPTVLGTVDGTSYVLTWVFDASLPVPNRYAVRVNGTAIDIGTSQTIMGGAASDKLDLFGTHISHSGENDGRIYGVALYDHALSAADMASAEAYMAAKCGAVL